MTPRIPTGDLETVRSLSLAELRHAWEQHFGKRPSPRIGQELLVQAIARRIQEQKSGGLSKSSEQELARRARESERAGRAIDVGVSGLRSGMTLFREWKGIREEVEVCADGFHWRGKRFGSLSHVARTITGTHWPGPRFFGLRRKRTPRDDSAGGRDV